MSVFFKALEQAERDRHGRQPAPPPPPPPSSPPPYEPGPPVAVIDTMPAVPSGTRGEIDEHLVSLLEPSSFAAEQYRALRHTVEQARLTAGSAVFAVGSPSAADGKTTTAINLAGALAQAPDARVLLLEADLRRPQMAHRLGLGTVPAPGLVDAILSPNIPLGEVARHLPEYNLSVAAAGRYPAKPYELLKSVRLGELLAEARRDYDYIVVDTPPLVAFPDCRIVGNWVDAWFLVVAAHRTSREVLAEALRLLDPSKMLGFIFTHDERFRANGRYYGGYYTGPGGEAR